MEKINVQCDATNRVVLPAFCEALFDLVRWTSCELPADVEAALKAAAKRDGVPVASKAADLLRLALELEEDLALGAIVEERERAHVKFISHEEFWKQNSI
ncbi:MAG: hypothetical protein AABY92_03600 [Thermodesulfobacteriota bacterium]